MHEHGDPSSHEWKSSDTHGLFCQVRSAHRGLCARALRCVNGRDGRTACRIPIELRRGDLRSARRRQGGRVLDDGLVGRCRPHSRLRVALSRVKVDYNDLNSAELYNRYIAETAANLPSADVLWSSAMDLQMKLTNDNFAARYKSPEVGSLPDWAVWRDRSGRLALKPAAADKADDSVRRFGSPRRTGPAILATCDGRSAIDKLCRLRRVRAQAPRSDWPGRSAPGRRTLRDCVDRR